MAFGLGVLINALGLDLLAAVALTVEPGSPVKRPLYQGRPPMGRSEVRILNWNNDLSVYLVFV